MEDAGAHGFSHWKQRDCLLGAAESITCQQHLNVPSGFGCQGFIDLVSNHAHQACSGCLSSGRTLIDIILGASEHTCQLQACIGTRMQSKGAWLPISSHRRHPPGNDSRLNPGINIRQAHVPRQNSRGPLQRVHAVFGQSIRLCRQGVPGVATQTGVFLMRPHQ